MLSPPGVLPDPATLSPEARAEFARFYPAYIAACQAVWQMGYDAGREAAEADMAAVWAETARKVRALATQPTHAEVVAARLTSPPRPEDFPGRGMDAVERIRAAEQRAKPSSEGKAA
jgi:hypothetical protein